MATRRTNEQIQADRARLYDIVAADRPMTVRQVFYRAVVAGLVPKLERGGYTYVNFDLIEMRRDGTIPYHWIADQTRAPLAPITYESVDQAVDELRRGYRQGTCMAWARVQCAEGSTERKTEMRALLVVGLALVIFASACGEDDDGDDGTGTPTATAAELCDYSGEPEPRPHPENEVRVSGGATCEEGSQLFFHPAPDANGDGRSIEPPPLEGWVCERELVATGGPESVDCANGPKRVQYLFH